MCYDNVQARDAVRDAGGVAALVAVLQAEATTAAARTVATALANLCDDHPANLAAVRACGGVAALVAVLRTGPDGDAVEQVCGWG